MVNNSIGIQDTSSLKKPIQFYWKEPAFFVNKRKPEFYWPLDGAMINGKLYLFMRRVRLTVKTPDPFNFQVLGADLLIIENPEASPMHWRSKTVPLEREYGLACFADKQHLYAYDQSLGFAKIPIGSIEDLSTWKVSLRLDAPKIASEFTVKEVGGQFFCIWLEFMTRKIMLSKAKTAEGPWSTPQAIYTCTEPAEQLVYSAKQHPQFSAAPEELVITYCENPKDPLRLWKQANVYRPIAIRCKLSVRDSEPIAPN